MGRTVIAIALAALVVTGCGIEPPAREAAAADSAAVVARAATDAHKDLSCASCHKGERADIGRASVPRESCTQSGCHEDAGPPQVSIATATFEHRNHGTGSAIAVNCAGCHTHNSGELPLQASVDACALCHSENLSGKSAQECKLCHTQPKHVTFTSQGIPVTHSTLPWLETGCARCHFDVLTEQPKVSRAKCSACHTNGDKLTRDAIAKDLHPSHRGVTCTSCHPAGLHSVTEMSSAVTLDCADCHTQAHDQPVKQFESAAACTACHRTTHAAQQRLVLGIVGDGRIMPSAKFLIGATCRSCHIPPNAPATVQARRGQAGACQSCHEKEYGKVLTWWLDGLRSRAALARAYVSAAEGALRTAPDSARTLLAQARVNLALVDSAGGQHNLELSDLIFRESVSKAAAAYRVAGRGAPAAPDFGNTPHAGTCSYCHYGSTEAWNYKAVPKGLHERLIGTRRTGTKETD